MEKQNNKKYSNPKPSQANELFEIGRMPPAAIDLEEAILGALMLERDCVIQLVEILKPEVFYKEAHSLIFEAIVYLFSKSNPIDLLTITNELKRNGNIDKVGGPYYLTQLTNRVASAANAEFHSRIILQKYIQRELIRINTLSIKEAYEDAADVFEMLDKQYTALGLVTGGLIKNKEKGSKKIFGDLIKKIENIAGNDGQMTGVPTTINEINSITNGWQNSDLVIIAANPGLGKSSFIKASVNGAIEILKRPVLIYSLEMSAIQVAARFLSEDTGYPTSFFLRQGVDNYEDMMKSINKSLSKYTDDKGKDLLIIDDTASLTINELRARAKKVKADNPELCMIVVDYLQLVAGTSKSTGTNRTLEIGEVSRGLKALAKDLDLPVLALSQLNRMVETQGGDMRPKLSHLRESGSLEQDSDCVVLLYRPEYYFKLGYKNFEQIEVDGQMIPCDGYAEAIFAKHRNGALGKVKMKFTDKITKFSDWDTSKPNQPDSGVSYDAKAGLKPNTDFDIAPVIIKKDTSEEEPF